MNYYFIKHFLLQMSGVHLEKSPRGEGGGGGKGTSEDILGGGGHKVSKGGGGLPPLNEALDALEGLK